MCLNDDYNSEIRRIVDVQWHAPRIATANFQVTQLIMGESPDESYEAYAITNILHEIIRDWPPPHNNAFVLVADSRYTLAYLVGLAST